MNDQGASFMIDVAAKLHRGVHIAGWFHREGDALAELTLVASGVHSVHVLTGQPHRGVERDLGQNRGFEISVLMHEAEFPTDATLRFATQSGVRIEAPLPALMDEWIAGNVSHSVSAKFVEMVSGPEFADILDIGGRDRSGNDYSKLFPGKNVVVLDIAPGDNVHVVGDAHALSAAFGARKFDAFQSVSVFEHLLMPWKVVVEVNRVLRLGGLGLVHTHQTIGMHDAPWDFWRFSDTAWDALFNEKTGFEILDRSLSDHQFIIPFVYTSAKREAEKACGFQGSTVLVRKTGECRLDWPASVRDITSTAYPNN